MFKKVLISEDMEDINRGVYSKLKEIGVQVINQIQYCDDAYLRIKKAVLDDEPCQLLITDLSFKTDYRDQKLTSGEALIQVIKEQYPNIKIIVYSVEDRLQPVRTLINEYQIDGYVCKSRRGLTELSKAIQSVYNDQMYLSSEVENALSPKNELEIDNYDIELIKQLSLGFSQEEISLYFKNNNTSPSSLSSIEKRLNKLRVQFQANNAIHLVAIVKDLGLI